jgi:hypothetical protein
MFTRALSPSLRLQRSRCLRWLNFGSNSVVAEDSFLTGCYVVYALVYGGQTVFIEALNVQQNDSILRYPWYCYDTQWIKYIVETIKNWMRELQINSIFLTIPNNIQIQNDLNIVFEQLHKWSNQIRFFWILTKLISFNLLIKVNTPLTYKSNMKMNK